MLPHEDETVREIRSSLKREFELARELCEISAKILPSGHFSVSSRPDFSDETFVVGFGVYITAIKDFRAGVVLCELGLSDQVDIMTRSLFEKMLCLRFLLDVEIPLVGFRAELKARLKTLPTQLRTRMYRANRSLQHRKMIKEMVQSGLYSEIGDVPGASAIFSEAELWEHELGEDLTRYITSKGYSGVNIHTLAKNLGCLQAYDSLYRRTSLPMHSGDGIRSVDLDQKFENATLKLEPGLDGIQSGLATLFTMLWGCAMCLRHNLALDEDGRWMDLWRSFQDCEWNKGRDHENSAGSKTQPI